GAAVRVYRSRWKDRIGLVVNLEPKDPASDSAEDLAAVERADAYMNRHYLEPVFMGRYPAELSEIYGAVWPAFPPADFELIRQPIDFLGINYYTRKVTRNDPSGVPDRASGVRQPGSVYTATGWEVHPPSFTKVLTWVKERF